MFDHNTQQRLLDWYAAGHRDLPWRHTRDPYCILVSEIMLQQTQADRVVPKYLAFIERFPTLHALADAPASEVIRAWAGLGYNRRALNLQRACRTVVEEHGGVMPGDVAELARLPGIGPYTAGAVACFAYGTDVGFVDTNIRRVLHRVVAGPEIPTPLLTTRQIATLASDLVPAGQGYAWNQALMEIGATVCRARAAACERCPLAADCAARPTIQSLLAGRPRRDEQPAPRFKETSRFARGRLVAALRAAPPGGLTLDELGRVVRPEIGANDAQDTTWTAQLVTGLMRDGLVVRADNAGGLRENTEPYDSTGDDRTERYALPE